MIVCFFEGLHLEASRLATLRRGRKGPLFKGRKKQLPAALKTKRRAGRTGCFRRNIIPTLGANIRIGLGETTNDPKEGKKGFLWRNARQ